MLNKLWKYDILKAFQTKDSIEMIKTLDELEQELDESLKEEDKKEEVSKDEEVNPLEARIAALEALVEKLMNPTEDKCTDEVEIEIEGEDKEEEQLVEDEEEVVTEEDKEEEKTTMDSFKVIFSDAAILYPNIKFKPTTTDSIDKSLGIKYKHQTLKKAYTTDSGKEAIDIYLNGLDINILDNKQVSNIFDKAVQYQKDKNNKAFRPSTKDSRVLRTNEEINKANREFWAKHQSTI